MKSVERALRLLCKVSFGDEVDFSYTGQFAAPAVTLSFTGQWRYIQPPSRSPERALVISNFIAHGHMGDYAIGQRINVNEKGLTRCTWYGVYCGKKALKQMAVKTLV